ncbi:MAG: hypothetical protein MZV70_60175 [Desulfobacterales bacterium]|nr:hypothetical protein [Desulfobacterales bacterium]
MDYDVHGRRRRHRPAWRPRSSLGDMGYKVLLVEKEPSIGGKMILLSKVFPTLDCASCISTPKMAQPSSHANIDLRVFSEVRECARDGGGGFQRQGRPQAGLRRLRQVHRLPGLREGLHRDRPRRVQRGPGLAARGPHRLSPGRAQEGGPRPRRHLALHLCLPGRHQGQRLHLAHPPAASSTKAFQPGPGGRAAGRHPGPRLLRPLPGRVHARGARATPRTSAASSASSPTGTMPATPSPSTGRRHETRQESGRRRLRAGGPERRLFPGPRRATPVTIFEAGAEAGRHAALQPARLPPAQGRGRPRHPQRDRPRRGDPRPARASSRWRSCARSGYDAVLRRDRHAEAQAAAGAGRGPARRGQRHRVPGRGQPAARRSTWPASGVAGRRRRQRGHRRGAHGAAAWAPRRCVMQYRRSRDEMPAYHEEIEAAEAEGVDTRDLLSDPGAFDGEARPPAGACAACA